jgi:limonene-1,2-epoxide hydrolase
MKRRTFLQSGAASALALPGLAQGAELTPAEKANVQVINDFCDAWATKDLDKIASYFGDPIAFRITEAAQPLTGREAIVARLKPLIDRSTTVKFELIQTFARGPLVVAERYDYFPTADKQNRYHVVGVFLLKNGKIAEWSDYVVRD